MKKRQHKFFRNERYKNKLEARADSNKTYDSNVYFLTKEPDWDEVQRRWNSHWPHWWSDERKWEYLTKPDNGRDYYTYYHRPSVPYSIQRYYKKAGRSKFQKFLKKRTNHYLRQRFKQYGEIYQHNEYRKIHEFWWELY